MDAAKHAEHSRSKLSKGRESVCEGCGLRIKNSFTEPFVDYGDVLFLCTGNSRVRSSRSGADDFGLTAPGAGPKGGYPMTIELLLGLCYDTSAFRSKSHCSLCHSHRRGIDDRASHAGTAVRPRHTQSRYRKSASLMPVQQKEWAPACVLLQKARTRLAFQCRRDQVRAGPSLKTAKALDGATNAARHRRQGDREADQAIYPRLLRCTIDFRFGSKARITAPQHRCLGVFHRGAQNFDAIGGTADIRPAPAPDRIRRKCRVGPGNCTPSPSQIRT